MHLNNVFLLVLPPPLKEVHVYLYGTFNSKLYKIKLSRAYGMYTKYKSTLISQKNQTYTTL